MDKNYYMCPCCGYYGLDRPAYSNLRAGAAPRGIDPPYVNYLGSPSYEVCNCCGFEFGYDDEPGTAPPVSFEQFLAEWIKSGCQWFAPEKKLDGWKLENQLRLGGITRSGDGQQQEVEDVRTEKGPG